MFLYLFPKRLISINYGTNESDIDDRIVAPGGLYDDMHMLRA